MAIGTSDGEFFEDEMDFHLAHSVTGEPDVLQAMSDDEKRSLYRPGGPAVGGGGDSRATKDNVQQFKDLVAREPYPNTPLTTRGTITRQGLDRYNMELRRSPADNTLRSKDESQNDWDTFNTPKE